MSCRYWLHKLAVRGCLITSILVAPAFLPQHEDRPSYGSTSQAAENPKSEQRFPSTHFSPGFKIDRDTYRAVCDQPKDKDHADLCQQWRVAEAAENQIWLSAFGIALLFGTLIFTGLAASAARNAARYAKDAADAANQSAIADREANTFARIRAELELRAYIDVVPVGINQLIGKEHAMGHVAVRNVGKLPARDVFVYVNMGILDERTLTIDRLPVPPDPENIRRVIQPGAELRQGSARVLVREDFISPGAYAFVWGIVYYDNSYEGRCFTRFCHRYSTDAYNRRGDYKDTSKTHSIIDADKGRHHDIGNEAS